MWSAVALGRHWRENSLAYLLAALEAPPRSPTTVNGDWRDRRRQQLLQPLKNSKQMGSPVQAASTTVAAPCSFFILPLLAHRSLCERGRDCSLSLSLHLLPSCWQIARRAERQKKQKNKNSRIERLSRSRIGNSRVQPVDGAVVERGRQVDFACNVWGLPDFLGAVCR